LNAVHFYAKHKFMNNVHKRERPNVQPDHNSCTWPPRHRSLNLISTHQGIKTVNDSFQKHSSTWVSFSYISFGAAAFMLVLGIWMMPLDLWGKGYLAMGILMLVQTTVNMTKTLCDNVESEKLIVKFNRDSGN